MMPVCHFDDGRAGVSCACEPAGRQVIGSSTGDIHWPVPVDPHSVVVEQPLAVGADAGQIGVTQPVQVLSDNQSSLSLCLYALMGFGLCRSAPSVRKLHLGWGPQWYHDGGPFQIGHTYAISPDCLCHALACCFVQPQGMVDPHIPCYHCLAVIARWRGFQFTPAVLAPRAPPALFPVACL
jgi:hypothetical protein